MSTLRTLMQGLALASALVITAGPAVAQTPATPPAAAKADEALPAAQTIIDRHIEAVGGREALEALQSVHLRGSLALPANGMSGSIEAFAARPNKRVAKMTIAGIGETSEGFDGTVGWVISPMTGPMLVTGEELAQKKFDADFEGALNAASRYETVKTLERTTFEGRPVYKVALTRKGGGVDIDFYDVETGLKAGSLIERKNPMGTVSVTTALSDYKKFGSILQPAVVTQMMMGAKIITTFTSIEYNKVDPSVFELPAEIKALVR